jgi:hypothetical protein
MIKTQLYDLIEQAQRGHMFGEITFCFRDGKLTFVRTLKTEAADIVRNETRERDEQRTR